MAGNLFGAAPALAGYQWQLHQAFIALIDAPSDGVVSLEELDDVVTHRNTGTGALETALAKQTKHSMDDGAITAKSTDLWKTLRVWAALWADPSHRPAKFVLATTDAVVADLAPLASATRTPEQTIVIQDALDLVAKAKANTELKAAFEAWESLPSADRGALLARVHIEPAQQKLAESTGVSRERLRRTGLDDSQTDFAYDYILGWFVRLVQERLGSQGCRIERAELQDKLIELHALCRPGALTTLHAAGSHPSLDVERAADPLYLRQLELLNAPEATLQFAVAMFHRARAERNSWLQRRVTGSRDLAAFDADLQNKWLQISTVEGDAAIPLERGWRTYRSCMSYEGNLGGMTVAVHVANGSFHILANGDLDLDEPTLGWHPDFRNLLKKQSE